MRILAFNDIPVKSIFVWGYHDIFVKTANAIPGVGMSKQPTNCIRLSDRHHCTMTADHKCIEVIQPRKLPKLKDFDKLKDFEVWMEGYACTGQSAPHEFLGKIKAENFNFACYLAVLGKCLSSDIDDFNNFYDVKNNSFWSCKCFDNESDAMYFG